jgi:inward rectifier potassium channel
MNNRFQRLYKKQRQRKLGLVHIEMRDGRFEVLGAGTWYSYWRDPYHLMLTIPWGGFLLLITLGYLAVNLIFAMIYWVGGDCIANARPGSFQDAFFFSVQTLASIGYGAIYPKTFYANTIVTIEAIIGLMGIALMTGLSFARFSRPTARVIFSRVAVITSHNGMATLMFRAANQRRNQIIQAQMQVYLLRDEITAEGKAMRSIYELKLVRSHTPSFMLTWTVMHPIDVLSPLYGITPEELSRTNTTLTVILSGIDETVAQVVHARHEYTHQNILTNKQFVDVFSYSDDVSRYIDYNLFHDVVSTDNEN